MQYKDRRNAQLLVLAASVLGGSLGAIVLELFGLHVGRWVASAGIVVALAVLVWADTRTYRRNRR
jgi:predicted MFS family arabinose efflux permease